MMLHSQMLFLLRKLASPEEWETVSALCGQGSEGFPLTLFDRRATLDILSRHRVAARTVELAKYHIAEARKALKSLPGVLVSRALTLCSQLGHSQRSGKVYPGLGK